MTVNHKDLTGAALHEPKGIASAAVDTVYVADGAGSGSFQNKTKYTTLNFKFEDISTARSEWIVCPLAGDVRKIWSVIDGAITGADCVFTFEIAGVLITGSTLTITQSGSAAGDIDSATPSAAKTLTAGQAIEIISDGGSTGAIDATFSFEIEVA